MPHVRLPLSLKASARELRRNLTADERVLWNALRARQFAAFKFRRQHPIGPFVLDFYCIERRLAIEVDGGGHADAETARYDAIRSSWLAKNSVRVLRFWNTDVRQNLDGVLRRILEGLTEAPSPAPPRAARPLPRGEAK